MLPANRRHSAAQFIKRKGFQMCTTKDARSASGEKPIRARLAYHEAGHALVAIVLGIPVTKVWLESSGEKGHTITSSESDPSTGLAKKYIKILRAGQIADALFAGEGEGLDAAEVDWQKINKLAESHNLTEEVRELGLQTRQLLSDHWSSVKRLAEDLLAREMLSGLEVEEILGLEAKNSLKGTDVRTD
jgi:ATP-dependent Zn protease